MFNPKENILDQQLAESGLENRFFMDLITGGAHSRNKTAKKNQKRQNKYQKDFYKHEGEELERGYNYAVEGLEIKKANDLANLTYEMDSRQQQWNYGMAIRDYKFAGEMRAYEQSKAQYTAQKGLNEVAESFANLQQDRFKMEQEIALQLDENASGVQYLTASHGLLLQKQRTKSAATAQMRDLGISALKAKGQAAARGQGGRSAAKTMNAITMEANAREADLINNLIYDTASVDMDLLALNQQKLQDDLARDLTRNNLVAADAMARQKIRMDRAQADLVAEANLMLKPEIAPPLPTPLALPLPQYQDIYKPKQGPEPPEGIAMQESIGAAIFGTALNVAKFAAAGTSGFTKSFNLGSALKG